MTPAARRATREPSPSWPTCSASTSPPRLPAITGGPATDTPNRLVYLLDHEYTPRALSWGRLKGADADRVSLLRAAANDAGCETILALADIRTQHGASADDDEYGYRSGYWRRDDDDDDDEDAPDGEPRNLEIHELIDSEVALTHWTGPDGARLEETSLSVAVRRGVRVYPDGRPDAERLAVRGLHGQLGQHA